ncbi:MAG TPA: LemA family protein [Bdellovibrionota bacterium]|nr:LemA family protein [Bdellovibrionota bacterium]
MFKGKIGFIAAIGIGVVLLLLLAVGIGGFSLYNRLVALNEQTNNAWSQVQNQYQRRFDLIPNLVETVKGYASHERETLQRVTEARARVGQLTLSPDILKNPQAFQMFEKAQGELTSALTRLMAVVENYPNLKANENFLQLQAQLEGTENRIAVERMRFNDAVREYNVAVRTLPTMWIARFAGFGPKSYFEATGAAQTTVPAVKF